MATHFTQPDAHLADVDPQTVGSFIMSASDVALVVDREGVIRDAASEIDQSRLDVTGWFGVPVDDVVTIECQGKIKKLVKSAQGGQPPRSSEINHLGVSGATVPVQYTAISTGNGQDVLLMGRDLSPMAALQSRLVSAQQTMEQKYEEQRQSEARYRMVFQSAAEAFIIVDGLSGQVRELNPCAADLFQSDVSTLIGRKLTRLFGRQDKTQIEKSLTAVANSGEAITLEARTALEDTPLELKIDVFRSRGTSLFLLTAKPLEPQASDENQEANLVKLLRLASEAVVLIDDNNQIIWSNDSFVELTQSSSVERVNGRPLSDFFDGPDVNLSVMLSNARQHGRLYMVPATARSSTGLKTDVELSIVSMPNSKPASLGVVMRNVSLRVSSSNGNGQDQLQSTEHLTELIGKVPLKELVKDSTDLIERSCIEAALKLTGNNRALAAKVLGLSRQALYTKLRRFGLAEEE